MAEEKDLSLKESTLISILERLSNQIEYLFMKLDEIEKVQNGLSSALENQAFQEGMQLDKIVALLGKLESNTSRYRSDMLGLVREQDRISNNMGEISGKQTAIFEAQEGISQNITDLTDRYSIQERTASEHLEHSVKHSETLDKDISAVKNHVTKLHADSEKRLTVEHQETQRQQAELRNDIIHRMLAFDEIEEMLNTLLSRTEPPPPKELPKALRMFYKGFTTLRGKLSWLLRKTLLKKLRSKRNK